MIGVPQKALIFFWGIRLLPPRAGIIQMLIGSPQRVSFNLFYLEFLHKMSVFVSYHTAILNHLFLYRYALAKLNRRTKLEE